LTNTNLTNRPELRFEQGRIEEDSGGEKFDLMFSNAAFGGIARQSKHPSKSVMTNTPAITHVGKQWTKWLREASSRPHPF